MGAAITSATPKSIYPDAGTNFAPARPLLELAKNKPNPQPNTLTDALLAKYNDYKERDYAAYIENCNTGQMVSNLRTGKLLLMRSVRDGRYLFVKRDGRFADNKTVSGKFQFYSTKLTSEWLSSRPERDPICPSDDDQIEEFISAVKIVQDHYDRKFFNTTYEMRESHSAQDFGTWITRFRFDPEKKDIVCELLDFPACRWDIRFIPEESSYFIYESKCSNAVLQNLLGAEIGEDDDENYGLRLIEQLAKTGGNSAGTGKENPYGNYTDVSGENTVIEMWLQPSAYCDIVLDENTKTVGGGTLKKGDLLKQFPNGMVVVGLNGMNTIWAIHAENVKDHIVSGLYHVQSFSGVGKGISDAVDAMKDLNDLHSQLLTHIKTHAMPGYGYVAGSVTEQQARDVGKARKNIAFDFTNAPDGARSVNDLIQPLAPSNPAQAAFEYKTVLENDLQFAMQVTDFSNGLPGVDNKTATGAKIGDANAEMMLVPQHLNKADHRKRADVVIYNLFRKYVAEPKWFAMKDKNGITKGKYISGDQFNDVDIDFEIVANSEVPQSPYQQKEALTQMFQFTGGAMGMAELKQVDPEFASEVATAYGVKLTIPKQTDIARVCRKRIEQARAMLKEEMQTQQIMTEVTGIPVDNANLAASIVSRLTPPISTKEPYVTQKTAWLAELLDSDEMQYAEPELRYVIEEMIHQHISAATLGQAQVAQDQSMAQIMSELPQILGEQAMTTQNQQMQQQYAAEQQMAQQQQQMQQTQMQNEQALAMEGQKAAVQEKQAEAQHQRAMAQSEDGHKKALQIEAVKQLGQMEMAKQKPKGK